MYVCICHGVTDRAIREARARGVVTIEQLGAETGCGSTCGCCRALAAELLGHPDGAAAVAAASTTVLALDAAA